VDGLTPYESAKIFWHAWWAANDSIGAIGEVHYPGWEHDADQAIEVMRDTGLSVRITEDGEYAVVAIDCITLERSNNLTLAVEAAIRWGNRIEKLRKIAAHYQSG